MGPRVVRLQRQRLLQVAATQIAAALQHGFGAEQKRLDYFGNGLGRKPQHRGEHIQATGSTGHGDRYLARVLGEAAAGASRTNTFLGERYRRIARRRGKKKAIVAAGRSILVIVWYLLSDPNVDFHDLGPGYYDSHINPERKKHNHIRQLEALGYKVTLEPAA